MLVMGVIGGYGNYGGADIRDAYPELRDLPTTDPIRYEIGDITLTIVHIIAAIIALIVFPELQLFLTRTRYGRAIRALADNPRLAVVRGVDVNRLTMLIFAIGSLLAGFAAALALAAGFASLADSAAFDVFGFATGAASATGSTLGAGASSTTPIRRKSGGSAPLAGPPRPGRPGALRGPMPRGTTGVFAAFSRSATALSAASFSLS